MSREKGDELEDFIAAKLERIYKYSRPTLASGATPIEKGDIKNPYFCIESKNHNTASISIKNDVWEKLVYEANSESKDAVYVTKNSKGHILASMSFEDWINIVIELIELRDNAKERR